MSDLGCRQSKRMKTCSVQLHAGSKPSCRQSAEPRSGTRKLCSPAMPSFFLSHGSDPFRFQCSGVCVRLFRNVVTWFKPKACPIPLAPPTRPEPPSPTAGSLFSAVKSVREAC